MKFGKLFFVVIITFVFYSSLKAQTSGTLTFSCTTASHSGRYGSDHVVAVWIEDNSNVFVKTNLRRAKDSHTINKHLNTWKANSSLNVIDAVTGATLTSYSSPVSVTWNGTNVSGQVVADGVYTLWIEESWDEGASGTSVTNVSFTKGPQSVHLTPANSSNFSGIMLDWVSSGTPVAFKNLDKLNSITAFPNPTKGLVNIDFFELTNVSSILVKNNSGINVYENSVNRALLGTKQIDLSKLPNGTYYLEVILTNKKSGLCQKIILKK